MSSPAALRTLDIYPEERLVVARFTGPMNHQDAIKLIDDAPNDMRFSKRYDGIVDFRSATFRETRPEKVAYVATYMIEQDFSHGRWVLLASKPMETALTLIYKKVASQKHPIQIYSTARAAGEFFALNLSKIDPLLRD